MKPHEACREFLLTGIVSGMKVLDVGCGHGTLMELLRAQGADARGIEIDRALVQLCRRKGFEVGLAKAEQLPFSDESFDAIVCSVVLPYTDERRAVSEWGRVLRPGGMVNATGHGVGYGLDYALSGPDMKRRFYGLRMLINTAVYQSTGSRIPGFLGDTICQTPARLKDELGRAGFETVTTAAVGESLGRAQFVCVRARK